MSVDDGAAGRVGEAERVRWVFDQMPLIMISYAGPEHEVVAVNAAFRQVVGREEMVGLPVREAMPELVGQRIVADVFDEVYTTGRTVVAREWRMQVERDGVLTDLYLDFQASPALDGDGRVVGVHGFATDVTARVAERQAAQARAEEAEQRYRAARDVVAELQAALLPPAVPVLPAVDVAARYLVAGEDQAAGGDWFDAVPLPDGRVGLVVGDIPGHGVTASAGMGQLRAVIAELLADTGDLPQVLVWAERMAARSPVMRAATLCAAVLDPGTGALRYATCGHPPPLVVAADGATRYLPATGGGPLGTGSAHRIAEQRLRPGDLLLLFSDGLVERPGHTLDAGLGKLAGLAGDAMTNRIMPAGAPASAAERVSAQSVELLTRDGYDDDVTVLAAQLRPEPVGPLQMEAPAVPGEIGQLQARLDAWLEPLQPTKDDKSSLELAVSELLANAVEHAYPPGHPGVVRLHAGLGADGVLHLDIADDGTWRQPSSPPPATSGRGLWLAGAVVDDLQVAHGDGSGGYAGGTVAILRHRLRRAAVLGAPAAEPLTGRATVTFEASLDEGPPLVLRVSGRVDITTAGRFAERLDTASRGGVHPLTVDLTDVDLLASAGVRVLFEARDRHAVHGSTLTMVAPAGGPAQRVLDLVGLDHQQDAPPP